MPNPAEIVVYVDKKQTDPSGTVYIAQAVDVHPEYLNTKGLSKTVTFKLEGASAKRITGLRYMNMSTGWAGKWYLPKPKQPYPDWWTTADFPESPGGWYDLEVVGHKTITVTLARKGSIYVYILEWEDNRGIRHVCDPKIRND